MAVSHIDPIVPTTPLVGRTALVTGAGRGLGLSIARNLMEMQHGTMNIFIDGDLFKVVLTLKSSEPPVEPQE